MYDIPLRDEPDMSAQVSAAPMLNGGIECGYLSEIQALRCLPGVDVMIGFAKLMSDIVVDHGTTHKCKIIIAAMDLILQDNSPNTDAVKVELDYKGDVHSLFVDRGVRSINSFMKLCMDVTHDLILTTIFLKGCPSEVSDIDPGTLYVSDLSECHSLEEYTPRISYMHDLGLELKSIVLHTGGYHFISLAMYGDLIYEYNDSRVIRSFKSWSAVILEPRFERYIVTSGWYYRKAARDSTEAIWNSHLNAQFQ